MIHNFLFKRPASFLAKSILLVVFLASPFFGFAVTTPAASDNVGLIGSAYYLGNLAVNGTNGGTWTRNWDNSGAVATADSAQAPRSVGADVIWYFDNVLIKQGGEFQFRVGSWTKQVGWAELASGVNIYKPSGTTLVASTSNIKFSTTPSGVDTRYDIILYRTAAGVFSLYLDYSNKPAATDNLGLIGTAYNLGNVKTGTAGSFAGNNWNGSGDLTAADSCQLPRSIGADVCWKFNDVWLKNSGEFRFWVGRSWDNALDCGNFFNRIYTPVSTTVTYNGQNLKITTPELLPAQYDVVVKRAANGAFSLYFTYTRVGLTGSCYYKGNRTDGYKHDSWTTNSLGWKASTDEGYEIEAEQVTSSGTWPACKYTYTYTGVILCKFPAVAEQGFSMVVDKGGKIASSQSFETSGVTNNACGDFAKYNFAGANGSPNQDVWKFQGTNDKMYTITWELDYSGSVTPVNANKFYAQSTSDAEWLAYRMGIMGSAYYVENDTTQTATWSHNWSTPRNKTTYDVAPVLSGTANRYVTWTFNGVIIRNGGSFKLRHEQNWNGRSIGFNSTQKYDPTSNALIVTTPITSNDGASFADGGAPDHNIVISNAILSGAVREPNWIYKLVLVLDRTTGIYSFGCNKTIANWVGGDVTTGMCENVVTGWRNPLNWDIEVVPLRSTDAVVDDQINQPVITTSAVCNNLTIPNVAGAHLTVDAGAYLYPRSVDNLNATNPGIILNNKVLGQACYLNQKVVAGTAGKVQVNTSLTQNITYAMGHVVSDAAITAANYNVTSGSKIWSYNTKVNWWDLLPDGQTLTQGSAPNVGSTGYALSPAIGYSVRCSTSAPTYTTVGVPNESDLAVVIPFDDGGQAHYKGYFLLANPYTTYLDMQAVYASGWDVNMEATIYVPHREGANSTVWWVWSLSTQLTVSTNTRFQTTAWKNLPPAQGFWVKGNTNTTPTLSLKKSARNINVNAQNELKSLSVDEVLIDSADVFRMGMSYGLSKWQTALVFRQGGIVDPSYLDTSTDANTLGLFSVKGGQGILISLLPMLVKDTIIDMGYNYVGLSSADVTLSAQSLSTFFPSVAVYLEDRDNGVNYDLRENGDVVVRLEPGKNTTRFALHFGANKGVVTSSIPASNDLSSIRFSQLENVVIVTLPKGAAFNGTARVLSVDGVVLALKSLDSEETPIVLPLKHQLYIVEVKTNLETKRGKFMGR